MKRRTTWIKRDALHDAVLGDLLAELAADSASLGIARGNIADLLSTNRALQERVSALQDALGTAFHAADKSLLGADFCNYVQRLRRWARAPT